MKYLIAALTVALLAGCAIDPTKGMTMSQKADYWCGQTMRYGDSRGPATVNNIDLSDAEKVQYCYTYYRQDDAASVQAFDQQMQRDAAAFKPKNQNPSVIFVEH